MKEIILIGGGGHCKAVIDVIEQEGHFEATSTRGMGFLEVVARGAPDSTRLLR